MNLNELLGETASDKTLKEIQDDVRDVLKRGGKVFAQDAHVTPVDKETYQLAGKLIIQESTGERFSLPLRPRYYREARANEQPKLRTHSPDGREIGLVPLDKS